MQAEIVNLAASLRRAQRRFEEAHRLIDLSIQLDHEAGEQHGAGEKMLVKSQILCEEGRLGDAITTAQPLSGASTPAATSAPTSAPSSPCCATSPMPACSSRRDSGS